MKKDKKYQEKYKQLKHQVQKEQRHAYNTYIEKLILDLPTNIQIKVLITNRNRKNSCLVSATSCPSFFKLSVLSDFMKEKSFFGFDWLLKLWSGSFVGRSRIIFSIPRQHQRQNTKRSSKFNSSNLNHHFSKITSDWLHTIWLETCKCCTKVLWWRMIVFLDVDSRPCSECYLLIQW
jgi:hypothetical protein